MDLTIDDIRKMYSIYDLLGLSGKGPFLCPFPDHPHRANTPSFSITWREGVQRFKCHGACQGRAGDVIDFVGYMTNPSYDKHKPGDVSRAARLLTQNYAVSEYKPEPDTQIDPEAHLRYPPTERARSYAQKRGIQSDAFDHFHLGEFDGALTIPCLYHGKTVGVKFRVMNGYAKHRFFALAGSKSWIFNLDAVEYKPDPLLILKAEIPAILAWQCGINACGLTGGETMKLAGFAEKLTARKIIYVADNDPDPRVRAQIMKAATERAALLFAELKAPPEAYKDWDEWLLAEPGACLAQTRAWLEG